MHDDDYLRPLKMLSKTKNDKNIGYSHQYLLLSHENYWLRSITKIVSNGELFIFHVTTIIDNFLTIGSFIGKS